MGNGGMSRRECLSLLLGAPLAMSACKQPPPRPVAGSVVGGRMQLGHRIRHLGNIPETAEAREVEVAIVGAGISGLSAAWRLARAGESRFAVFELESRAGGTSTYGMDGVVPYPWAAHYLPLPSEEHRSLCELLDEMGVTERDSSGALAGREEDLVRDPEERLFVGGQWLEGLVPSTVMTSADRQEFERFQSIVNHWVAFRDAAGRRAFAIPLAHCSSAAELSELDRMSAADWFRTNGFRSAPLWR